MTIYVINNKNSNDINKPSSILSGDKLVFNCFNNGKLKWKVTKSGFYNIKSFGAKGGGTSPGKGGIIQGSMFLKSGQILEFEIFSSGVGGGSSGTGGNGNSGISASAGPGSSGGAGGGGSKIYLDDIMIMAAGGGGGSGGSGGYASNNRTGSTASGGAGGTGSNAGENINGSRGSNGKISSRGTEGTGGNGATSAIPAAGGGGGYSSSGYNGGRGNAGILSRTVYDGSGGAGGGGGGAHNPGDYYNASGGGGGGGRGGDNFIDLNLFNDVVNSSSLNNGDGYIEIIVELISVEKYLLRDMEGIKKNDNGAWVLLAGNMIIKEMFEKDGMDSLSILNRNTNRCTINQKNKTEENKKTFRYQIDLNKYPDVKSVTI